jgi:uncharacterized protein (DUF952 family)
MNIVHITSRLAWDDARKSGEYVAPSLKSAGFIHCSTYAQALPVAEKYYKGQTGLVLLVIDPSRLASGLKWEPSAEGAPPPGVPDGDMFPHIYGPINLDAVVEAVDFNPGPNNHFSLPPSLLADH